jgi:hypothetical protein
VRRRGVIITAADAFLLSTALPRMAMDADDEADGTRRHTAAHSSNALEG